MSSDILDIFGAGANYTHSETPILTARLNGVKLLGQVDGPVSSAVERTIATL